MGLFGDKAKHEPLPDEEIPELFWKYYKKCSYKHLDHIFGAAYREVLRRRNGTDEIVLQKAKHIAVDKLKEKKAYVKLGLTVGVGVTGALTGGLGIGFLMGLAGGKWVISKLIEAGFTQWTLKTLRHWAANNPEVQTMVSANKARAISDVAKQGLRRGIDHFLKARAMQNNSDMSELLSLRYESCSDAVLHCHWISSFMHEADKARNYILPCLDLLYVVFDSYRTMTEEWDKVFDAIRERCAEWIARSNHSACSGFCLEWIRDIKDIYDLKELGLVTNVDKDTNGAKEVDIDQVLDTIKEIRDRMVTLYSTAAPEPNYGGIFTINHNLPLSMFMGQSSGVKERVDCLINDVYNKVEKHNIFIRASHRLRNWNTRKLPVEKALGVTGDLIDVGTTLFGPGWNLFSGMGKTGISLAKKGGTLVNLLQSAGFGAISLKKGGKDTPAATLCPSPESLEELKGKGLKASDVITDMTRAYVDGLKKAREAQALAKKDIGKCLDIWKIALKCGESQHAFAKMQGLALAVLTIAHPMGIECVAWSQIEKQYWADMKGQIARWLVLEDGYAGRHGRCGKVCYSRNESPMNNRMPKKRFKGDL